MDLKVGCCGFPVSRQKYYEKLGAVEVQRTFYQLPRPETARKWRLSAPPGFEFTLKAWQIITHEPTSPTYRRLKVKMDDSRKRNCGSFKPTDEVLRAWQETEKIASILGARVVVFQCPPSFIPNKTNKDNLRKFFKSIKRKRYRFAWEPRGGWPERDVKKLCEELDLVHCVDPFKDKAQHGDIRYFRLHGIGGYKYGYTDADLKRMRDICADEAGPDGRVPIYVFFNNISMMEDALRFKSIVKSAGRIKEPDLSFLRSLCHEIELAEEDERVRRLSREADRIVSLILYTDYQKVDIEIEKTKLRELCRELFPDKEYLYEIIYEQRFDRIWRQFREEG